MNPQRANPPEPLQQFDSDAPAIRKSLEGLDANLGRYREKLAAGLILPNAIEAVRVELTYHSNAIEGSTLTLRDTQLILEGKSPVGEKPLREIYEARNHDRALRMIERWVRERAIAPISEQDFLEMHRVVLAEIDDANAGRFRTGRVLIAGTGFIPPASEKFGALLPELLSLANRPGEYPALLAAELHYNFVAVHPFNDGNGRTARLLMNYFLLQRGFPLTVVEVGERGAYLAALDEANAGRSSAFAAFIASCASRSIDRLIG